MAVTVAERLTYYKKNLKDAQRYLKQEEKRLKTLFPDTYMFKDCESKIVRFKNDIRDYSRWIEEAQS